ncbi:XRE family transcriptional regulator [Pseudomonas sp. TH08]|uniref:XRE family transcriptional regulator n=1 Tax=unclassified Pseudomonas TaxID=196821 RepID=UPI001914B2C9|nr:MULTISPECIES: XRE family transcriptional regulator [unclassified Pseudomonas]MBK5376263.1 XRE family transcriptional regulator [Pseudomonas sp. TH43]MBK5533253.1 XRE family transcriptional regulator [Pseudomonas sp. TH08]
MASLAMNHILERIALFQFTPTHCLQARAMLGWSVDQLSREAEVSAEDIQRFEAQQEVADAARLALAYRFESQGLVFFPGFAPGRSASLNAMAAETAGRGDYAMAD